MPEGKVKVIPPVKNNGATQNLRARVWQYTTMQEILECYPKLDSADVLEMLITKEQLEELLAGARAYQLERLGSAEAISKEKDRREAEFRKKSQEAVMKRKGRPARDGKTKP